MITRSYLHEKINYLSLLLIAFSIPFNTLVCHYLIAIFVINQVAEGNIFTKLKAAFQNKFVLVFLGFYLLHLAGLAFTDNMKDGLFDLEKKDTLLIFPIFLYVAKTTRNQVIKILLAFVLACFILTIIFTGAAIYDYFYTSKTKYFIVQNLSSITGIHRVYASMYFLFCIYILSYIKRNEIFHFKYSKALFYFLVTYFTLFILMLTSRNIVILTVISFTTITIIDIIQTKKVLKGLGMLALFFFLFGSFLASNKIARRMMTQTYKDLDKGNSEHNYTGPNQRIEIWKASLQVVKENYLLGVGTGDTEKLLLEKYVANNFKWGIKRKFNAHNQYLQTMIGLGIIGLLTLLLSFGWPAINAYKNKYFLYPAFIFLFAFACLTESMLCVQKGIVFYAFFNSLLAFHYPKKNPITTS